MNRLLWEDVLLESTNEVTLVISASDKVLHETIALGNTTSKLSSALPDHLSEVTGAGGELAGVKVVVDDFVVPGVQETFLGLGVGGFAETGVDATVGEVLTARAMGKDAFGGVGGGAGGEGGVPDEGWGVVEGALGIVHAEHHVGKGFTSWGLARGWGWSEDGLGGGGSWGWWWGGGGGWLGGLGGWFGLWCLGGWLWGFDGWLGLWSFGSWLWLWSFGGWDGSLRGWLWGWDGAGGGDWGWLWHDYGRGAAGDWGSDINEAGRCATIKLLVSNSSLSLQFFNLKRVELTW